MKSLVIGFGSTLRSDDALGRLVARRVRRAVDVECVDVLDQCAPTPELAECVARAARVVFVDASIEGPQGQVVTRRLSSTSLCPADAHGLTPQTVLGLAESLYGRVPETHLVTVRGQSFELGDWRLSPDALRGCGQAVREILQILGDSRRAE